MQGVTPVPIPNTEVKPLQPMILLSGKVGYRRLYGPPQVTPGEAHFIFRLLVSRGPVIQASLPLVVVEARVPSRLEVNAASLRHQAVRSSRRRESRIAEACIDDRGGVDPRMRVDLRRISAVASMPALRQPRMNSGRSCGRIGPSVMQTRLSVDILLNHRSLGRVLVVDWRRSIPWRGRVIDRVRSGPFVPRQVQDQREIPSCRCSRSTLAISTPASRLSRCGSCSRRS